MHMVDRQLGEILTLLKELKIDDNTILFVCGDNGGQDYFKSPKNPHGFFGPNLNPKTGERFRAGKGSLYEGGLKVPFLVRWPEKIKAGSVSDHLCYFPDIMPTLSEISGAQCLETDGLSLLPTLTGQGTQKDHTSLYWEYVGQTAVRMKNWKAYKAKKGDWKLFDLSKDIEETNDLSAQHPAILKKLVGIAKASHQPIKPGVIYDKELSAKDRKQAPHGRGPKKR